MVIKPYVMETTAEDILAQSERHTKDCKRDIYIYDRVASPYSTHEFINNEYAGVVQSTKLLVKGFPNDPGVEYDRPESERTTLVKFLHVYNAHMNNILGKNIAERFSRSTLRPVMAVTAAYTDTGVVIRDGFGYPTVVPVQFSVSVYSVATKVLSTIMCNPVIMNGNIIQNHRLDVTDPRYNIIHSVMARESASNCVDIPDRIRGEEVIKLGQTSIVDYESYFERNNSFTESALMENAQLHKRLAIAPTGKSGNIFQKDQYTRESLDLIDKRIALRNLIVDVVKGSTYSLFETFTMMYETGKDSGFKEIKSPFRQYVEVYMNEKLRYVGLEFNRLCEKITESFGHVRIILHVNDVEHVVRCIFKEEPASKYNSMVTLRMTKLECLQDYITETLYGSPKESGANRLLSFKDLHDLDILNYYSTSAGGRGESVLHEGVL